jgi:hypothetical protein
VAAAASGRNTAETAREPPTIARDMEEDTTVPAMDTIASYGDPGNAGSVRQS